MPVQTHKILIFLLSLTTFIVAQTPIDEHNDSEAYGITSAEDHIVAEDDTFDTKDVLAALMTAEYSVDYQTDALILKHGTGGCKGVNLSIPLTYNAKSKVKGILGYGWSLGIENDIIQKDEKTLLYFDAKEGKTYTFLQETEDKKLFNYKGNIIRKINWGYLYGCNDVEQQFDTKGKLVRIAFPSKAYSLEYKNDKLDKVLLLEDIYAKPYLSLEYLAKGVRLTYHQNKNQNKEKEIEHKKVTFLQNEEGYLSSVLEGKTEVHKYTYNEDNKLNTVHHYAGKVFDFTYAGDVFMDVHITLDDVHMKYNYYNGKKEQLCIVYTETNYGGRVNLYQFKYYDTAKTKLRETRRDFETYGFDRSGHVNYYAKLNHSVTRHYNKEGVVEGSTVVKDGNVTHYKYGYTKNGKLQSIKEKDDMTKLTYNDKGLMSELEIDTQHVYFSYGKTDADTTFRIDGKGEARAVALTAMQKLMEKIRAGDIKSYPHWIR